MKRILTKKSKNTLNESGGYTALHSAAQNGHKDIAKLLIDNGADIEASDK